ncbi:MAG: hypothetical protein P0Y53_08705 [Candidatus Pseudobacter hemicellulosilyticus]|uniref:Polysaccharide chain length determinant N-terminal domain-containing protein n=1 Tax=Candidatus Pseudobacter hemicellulosilyticus TaxID=3121375 RepID=A0AAJ6BJN4_9BACT|nr:MAG: hypothetical protein P0Y53_08705 [Pseudobacter sp.]
MEENKAVLHTDEMDMLVFMANVRKFLKLALLPMLLLGAVGLAAGLLLVRKSQPVYSNKLLLQVRAISGQEAQEMISSWSDLIRTQQLDELAQLLHCPKELLAQVKEVSATLLSADQHQNNNALSISVSVIDPVVLPGLQEALVHGFEQNGYLTQRVQARQERLRELISRATLEIRQLDSLKKDGRNNFSPAVLGKDQRTSSLMELTEKKTMYEEELKFSAPVNILQGFLKTSTLTQSSYVRKLIPAVAGGLVIGFLLGAFRYCRYRYPLVFKANR